MPKLYVFLNILCITGYRIYLFVVQTNAAKPLAAQDCNKPEMIVPVFGKY